MWLHVAFNNWGQIGQEFFLTGCVAGAVILSVESNFHQPMGLGLSMVGVWSNAAMAVVEFVVFVRELNEFWQCRNKIKQLQQRQRELKEKWAACFRLGDDSNSARLRWLHEEMRFNKQNIDLVMAQKANHQRQMLASGSFALAMLGVTIASIYFGGSIASGGILPIITALVGITITLIRLYWVTSVDHVAILKNDIYQKQHDLTTRLSALRQNPALSWLNKNVSYRSANHLFHQHQTSLADYIEHLFKKNAHKADAIISRIEELKDKEMSEILTDDVLLQNLGKHRRGLVHGGFRKTEGQRIINALLKLCDEQKTAKKSKSMFNFAFPHF